MKNAVGNADPGADEPRANGSGDSPARSDIPDVPAQGAIQGALGRQRQALRACVAGQSEASRATLTFESSGRVQSVQVSGPSAGTPAEACIKGVAGTTVVGPFRNRASRYRQRFRRPNGTFSRQLGERQKCSDQPGRRQIGDVTSADPAMPEKHAGADPACRSRLEPSFPSGRSQLKRNAGKCGRSQQPTTVEHRAAAVDGRREPATSVSRKSTPPRAPTNRNNGETLVYANQRVRLCRNRRLSKRASQLQHALSDKRPPQQVNRDAGRRLSMAGPRGAQFSFLRRGPSMSLGPASTNRFTARSLHGLSIYLVLPLCASVFAGCSGPPEGIDDIGSSSDPIVNGLPDNADPAVVQLNNSDHSYCTGQLIAPHVVLTAAHCLAQHEHASGLCPLESTVPNSLWRRSEKPQTSGIRRGQPRPWRLPPSSTLPRRSHRFRLNRNPLQTSMFGQTVRIIGFGTPPPPTLPTTSTKLQGTGTFDSFTEDHIHFPARPPARVQRRLGQGPHFSPSAASKC